MQDGSSITWSSETFAQNQNANAIRFGTLYNFRFDADQPPQSAQFDSRFLQDRLANDGCDPGANGWRHAKSHPYGQPESNGNCDGDANVHSNSNSNGDCDIHAYTNTNSYSHAYAYRYSYGHSDSHSYGHSDSHSYGNSKLRRPQRLLPRLRRQLPRLRQHRRLRLPLLRPQQLHRGLLPHQEVVRNQGLGRLPLRAETSQELTQVKSDAKTHLTPKAICARFVPTRGTSFCEKL